MARIAVVGAGVMVGCAIAGTFAEGGADTTLVSRRPDRVGGISGAINVSESLPDLLPDVVIEAVPEDLDLKRQVFLDAEARYTDETPLLASNTSGLDFQAIAAPLARPDRFLGLHYFYPADRLPLVEIIRVAETADAAVAEMRDLLRLSGRDCVVMAAPLPGGLVNRLQHAILHEAYDLLSRGLTTPEDVDRAAMTLLGPRMCISGLLRQKDLGGLEGHMLVSLSKASNLREGIAPDPSAIEVVAEPGPVLSDCGFVQENVPERLDLKRDLLAAVESFVAPETILATSTTALRVSDIQMGCVRPGRVVAGHPLNTPHLVPLVEVSGGALTDTDTVDRAMAFYAGIGKEPVRLARDVEGHIAGRLSAALWREAVHLVESGVASVEDIDRAVVHGPGLRWAAGGPHMTYHLGGGAGGMAAYLDHLGPSQRKRWEILGAPHLTDALKSRLAAGTDAEAAGRSVDDLTAARDDRIARILRATGD